MQTLPKDDSSKNGVPPYAEMIGCNGKPPTAPLLFCAFYDDGKDGDKDDNKDVKKTILINQAMADLFLRYIKEKGHIQLPEPSILNVIDGTTLIPDPTMAEMIYIVPPTADQALVKNLVDKWNDTQQQINPLLRSACEWVEQQEKQIKENGVPLLPEYLKYAEQLRIPNPSEVRILKVAKIPAPQNKELLAIAQGTNLLTERTRGMTCQYGIFLCADSWNNPTLIVHELVHVSQYSRLGGIGPFLNHYIQECVLFGYPNGPLEQEAISTSSRLCRQ